MKPKVFLMLALLAGCIIIAGAAAAADKNPATVVELESEGKVEVKPNKAIFNFTVVTEAAQAEEAAKTNAKEAETFLAAIKKVLGAEDKVKTLQYQVVPIFKRLEKVQGQEKIKKDEIAGYRAYHRFEVELLDLGKIGQLADTAIKNGVNEVQGPYFGHTQQEDLQNQAAVKALARARKLADALAQAAGMKVKRVTKMSTSHSIHPRFMAAAKGAPPAGLEGDAAPPIEVGDITYQSRLTVTFELSP